VQTPPEFTHFVAAASPSLRRTAYLLVGDVHRADDLVQETLFRVARQWERCANTPYVYARRVLDNLAIDHYRWWARRPEISAPDLPAPAPDNPADAADRRIDLAAALARLTPRQRALLICRFYEDLTETQAAQALGISPNTDKSQTRRALDEHLRLGRGSELGGVAGPGCRRAGPAPEDEPARAAYGIGVLALANQPHGPGRPRGPHDLAPRHPPTPPLSGFPAQSHNPALWETF